MNENIIFCRNLRKSYYQETEVPVLMGIDLDVAKGDTLAIVGASGSGKSTLLHLLGGLERPPEAKYGLWNRTSQPFLRKNDAGYVTVRSVSFISFITSTGVQRA